MKPSNFFRITLRPIFWQYVFGILLFTYAFIRAWLLDITYDEAWSIDTYVSGSFQNIFSFTPTDSNNHLLNSLLIKLLYLIFPETTFVARIPALFSFLGYTYFAGKICDLKNSNWIGLSIFLLLLSNPFMLDFFSLARGYALAFFFLLASLYYFKSYLQTQASKMLFSSFVFALLASISILSFLNFYAVLLAFAIFHQFTISKVGLTNRVLALSLPSLSLFLLLYRPLQKLTEFGNLYYGGKTSLYTDSGLSLSRYSLYSMHPSATANWALLLFLMCLILAWIFSGKNQDHLSLPRFWLLIVFAGCLLLNELQVKFLKGYYLIDRTALFYYPLILLGSLEVVLKGRNAPRSNLMLMLLALLMCCNFVVRANLNKTVTWFFDAHTRTVLAYLEHIGKTENRTIRLATAWPFEKGTRYYLSRTYYPHVNLTYDPEYYLFLDSDLDQIDYFPKEDIYMKLKHTEARAFKNEHVFLYRLK